MSADSIQLINHTSLRIDTDNPRLPEYKHNQREALRELFSRLSRKVFALTQDIVRHGLNPAELPIVMPDSRDAKRFIVLEGNRRIVALRILEQPDLVSDLLAPSQRPQLHKLAADYHSHPVTGVPCVVVGSRAEAHHWIRLRHTGENEGAGVVPWGAEERARFLERGGKREPYRQVLDFLSRREELSSEERREVPVTSLRRLLSTPEVRTRLGLELKDGVLLTRLPEQEVAKGLLRVIDDFLSGTRHTKDIYHADDRRRYISEIPDDELPDPSAASGNPRSFDELGTPQGGTKKRSDRKPSSGSGFPAQRRFLIPRNCSLRITEPRISRIGTELRKLRLGDMRNAVSVLFRVFLELSLDAYIDRENIATARKAKLRYKLTEVANHLAQRGGLTKDQLRPVRRAAQRQQTFPGASIATFNDYVHSRALQPNTEDLLIAWEEFQPLFEAIWK